MINPVIPLSLARIGVGSLSLADPDTAFKSFMLEPAQNPQHDVVTRMFGSREIALGAATLLSLKSGKKGWILAGIAVDVADTAGALLAGQKGSVPAAKARMFAGVAGFAALSGVLGLKR